MSFFHFQWRFFYFSVGWKFQKNEATLILSGKIILEGKEKRQQQQHHQFSSSVSLSTNTWLELECFMVSRLCIVSLLLLCSLLLYVFPSTLNIFQNIMPSPLAQRVRTARHDTIVLLCIAVSHWVVGVLRNCFLSIAIVLQLQFSCRRKETKRTKWMMLSQIIMDNFKR